MGSCRRGVSSAASRRASIRSYSRKQEADMIVTRIAPMSLAKILGCVYAVMGLIFGAFIGLIASTVGQFGGGDNTAMPQFIGMMFGVGSIVFLPVFYGAIGFIGGVLTAVLYNIV